MNETIGAESLAIGLKESLRILTHPDEMLLILV